MQTATSGFNNTILRNDTVQARARVIAEWNHNRFASTVTAKNNSGGGRNSTIYPVASIAKPNRPNSGIAYAVVGQATVAARNGSDPRFKVATEQEEMSYSYWVSPSPSASNRSIANAQPQVVYNRAYPMNKIVLKFEMVAARTGARSTTNQFRNRPTAVDIFITRDNTNWTRIATDRQPNDSGVITLFRQANGTWGTTAHYDSPQTIRGVRAVIKTMQSAGLYANVIEVSGRLVQDLSNDVVSFSVNKTREEQSATLPVGTMEANSASISLVNADTNRYDPNFAGSDLNGLIDVNTKLTVSLGVLVGDTYEYIPQGVYYADSWNYSTDSPTVDIECTDFSKFLQQELMPPTFFAGYSIVVIIREILERMGFLNISLQRATSDPNFRIPYVWFNEEQTVWDALAEIARADMGAFWFSESGTLIIQSRNRIYNTTTPQHVISSVHIGNNQPNLIELGTDFSVEANKAIVKYSPLKANTTEFGDPLDSALWQADETIVVHGSPLQTSMTATSDKITLSAKDAETWPLESYVNIEGEIMHYRGKQVRKGTTNQYAIKYEPTEYRHADGWRATGVLWNVRRGLKGSKATTHSLDIKWGIHRTGSNGKSKTTNNSMRSVVDGRFRLQLPASVDGNDWLQSARGSLGDAYSLLGTSVMFSTDSMNHGMAGLCFNRRSTTDARGYYVELVTTKYASNKMNGTIGNIRIYKMDANGARNGLPAYIKPTRFEGETDAEYNARDARAKAGVRGYDMAIVPGRLYYIEVAKVGNSYTIYVNGQQITSFTDSTYTSGLWGMFVRGNTKADFEYFYAHNPSANAHMNIEEQQMYNRVNGDYISGYAARLRTAPTGSHWFFDEFGPIVHESKEIEVDYAIAPALNARIINFNDWQTVAYDHTYSPFGSRFMIDNAARQLAVVHGEDTWTYPGETFTPTIMISGQAVIRDEEKIHEVENDAAIRRRGPVEVEVQNPWIQSEDHAKSIGEFITKRWASPVDVVTANVFIHPALQTGDLVSVNVPRSNMTTDKFRYYVIGIELSYDGAISGSLTLRRAR